MAAVKDWSRVCAAFEVLGVDQREEEVFWLVLAAITNLGVLASKIGEYLYLIVLQRLYVLKLRVIGNMETNLVYFFYTSKDVFIIDSWYKVA